MTQLNSSRGAEHSVLYIDMAYSLAELKVRKHLQFFEARHSGDYFSKVIGLHPLADRVTPMPQPIVRHRFSDRQDVVEACSASRSWPSILFPLNFLFSQWQLFRYVAEIVRCERISLIATTDPLYSGLFGVLLKRATRRPLAVHLIAHYDNLYESTGRVAMPRLIPFRWLEKLVIRYVFRRADLVAAGTKTLARYAEKMGADRENVSLFPVSKNMNACHRTPPDRRPSARSYLRTLDVAEERPLILLVSRLEPVKLVDHAIQAMVKVVEEVPTAVLLIAGDGSLMSELTELAEDLGIIDNIRFLGLIDQDIIASLVPHCVIASPLTGMALFETSMGGAPAVAYDVDTTVAALVETGTTGFLVQTGDIAGMADGLIKLLTDGPMRSRLGANMRLRAMELSDMDKILANEHKSFDRILSGLPA